VSAADTAAVCGCPLVQEAVAGLRPLVEYIDHQGLGDVEIRGLHGFRRVVEAVHKSSDVRVTIEDIVAAEDKAALRLRWHGINRAGRTVTRETLDLLRFVDDRLIEHWGAELFRREG
jgi:predicted ester cyclase